VPREAVAGDVEFNGVLEEVASGTLYVERLVERCTAS
jgi:hypothetical protein